MFLFPLCIPFVSNINAVPALPTQLNISPLFFISENLNKIDLLKIDTEGFVYEVLKGCKQSIKNIKLILVELHYSDLYDNHNPEKIHNYLIQSNFKFLKSFKFPFMNWEDRLYLNSF